jgi:hypothetical protein
LQAGEDFVLVVGMEESFHGRYTHAGHFEFNAKVVIIAQF